MFLNLEIPATYDHQISDLIEFYFDKELIDENYSCEKCKHDKCIKTPYILTYPLVLVLFVKRYVNYKNGNSFICKKKDNQINFEANIQVGDKTYQINSIINHIGNNINSGHYISEHFKQETNEWTRCSDNVVERVSASEVLSFSRSNSYIYFYTKN
jgi:uncharacterized UBP type Zn finger protein